MDIPDRSTSWRIAGAGLISTTLFLVRTLPTMPAGSVIGTGQDEWYNMIRGLRALYEHLDPAYFIHPALYYEVLALLYAVVRSALALTGVLSGGAGFLDYVLTHQSTFLDLARYASVASGAIAVLAAAGLAGVLSGAAAALLAGVLVGSLPLLQTLATSIRVDALGLAAFLAATVRVVRHYRQPGPRSLWLAAAAIGVAAAANYPGAVVLVLLGWFEAIREGPDTIGDRARGFARACALAFAVFTALNPYVLIDLPMFLRWFSFQAGLSVTTHPHGEEPNAARYLDLLRAQGVPVVAACLGGVIAIVRPRQAVGAVAAFGILYLAAFSVLRTQYDRFVLPAIALLCIAGASWVCAQLSQRVGARAAAVFAVAAAVATIWLAAARQPSVAIDPGPDYRAEMLAWIADHVPPSATLIYESDTLPLVQIAYDPAGRDRAFQSSLRQAYERLYHPLPQKIVKTQFIAAVYNYDPKLFDDGEVFFLGSSQNRDYITANRAVLAAPAAFYDTLDARATVVHEAAGYHERLVLYTIRPAAH